MKPLSLPQLQILIAVHNSTPLNIMESANDIGELGSRRLIMEHNGAHYLTKKGQLLLNGLLSYTQTFETIYKPEL